MPDDLAVAHNRAVSNITSKDIMLTCNLFISVIASELSAAADSEAPAGRQLCLLAPYLGWQSGNAANLYGLLELS